MIQIGTTFTPSGKKALLCGSGELGKEVAIELERYGVHVVAIDRYAGAPAMHVAQSSHVLSMLDGDALEKVIREEKPDLIIPEVEAIATDRLVKLEAEGFLTGTPDPSDKRSRIIFLTPKGKQFNKTAKALSEELLSTFYKDFTDEEKSTFLRLLLKIQNNFKE
jgi:hypothetical protein